MPPTCTRFFYNDLYNPGVKLFPLSPSIAHICSFACGFAERDLEKVVGVEGSVPDV